VRIVTLPVFDKGPQEPKCVINDQTRGPVTFLTSGEENFMTFFYMKVGQIRGQAYHKEGNVIFHLLSGSYIFMTSDRDVTKVEKTVVHAPAQIHVLPTHSHVFIPLTDGMIIESADIGTKEFLSNVIRVNAQFAPHIEQTQKDIADGKYRAYAIMGLPTDITK